jgi:glyoxylase-like metal-dependent hydrolase (beta-lactamase superfamily II)
MARNSNFENVKGIRTIFAQDSNWPNPSNIFVIPDESGFSLIDVGCGGIPGIEHLVSGLSHWGLKLQHLHTVILSHAHPDHMGALGWILEKTRPKVCLHHLEVESALVPANLEKTFDIPLAKKLWASFEPSDNFQEFGLLKFFEDSGCAMSAAGQIEEIHAGDILDLGNFVFEVLHTPGHSPGHISLFERNRRILLPGDLVGKGPAWYTPSSGGVIAYLDSLVKLEALDAAIVLPAHGRIIETPLAAIQKIRKKLLERESLIRVMLDDGAKSAIQLTRALFQNPLLHFFPGCAITESHIIKLEKEGVIKREGHRIVPVTKVII